MADNDVEIIKCPIGKWYFKRMTLLGLLLLGFGGWFLYDGFVGYPNSQVKAVAYEAFAAGAESNWEEYSTQEATDFSEAKLSAEDMEVVKAAHQAGGEKAKWQDFAIKKKISKEVPAEGSENRKFYDAFQARNGGAVWAEYAAENGLPEDPAAEVERDDVGAIFNAFEDGGKDREWAPYAAANDLPSDEPYFHGKGDILEQHVIGGLCAAAGVIALIMMLLNKNRSVSADGEAYYPKPSTKVPFSDIFRIDTRKWRRKGLAYAFYKEAGGDEKKAVLDDLKFVGSQSILDRMLENFEGELIEEVVDDEDEEEAAEPDPDSAEGEAKTEGLEKT